MKNHIYVPAFRNIGGTLLLVGLFVMLGPGLAPPAYGAGLASASGSITGTVTISGKAASGVSVELHQRSNSGVDTLISSATSDGGGSYTFTGQPSAPNDAFYYVRLTGGNSTISAWYSFPIIYQSGTDFTVPSVELGDVQLASPGQGATLTLPTTLQWQIRRSGETYRVFVYAQGQSDKVALDSGSLGAAGQFTISQGALPDGSYEAVVQVRDAVVGYGQSQARFRFTIGKAAAGSDVVTPPSGIGQQSSNQQQPAPQQSAPQAPGQPDVNVQPASPDQGQAESPDGTGATPSLQLNLSADKSSAGQGDRIMYTIEVTNTGAGTAGTVVVTDQLPTGVTVDASQPSSTVGTVQVQGNLVTAQVGDLAPNAKATIQIPALVTSSAGSSLSNQANAQYKGASEAVRSNAFISQVAAPATGPAPSQPAQQPAGGEQGSQQGAPPAQQAQSQPQTTQQNQPPATQPKAQPRQPAAPLPQTGGSFPVVFALILVVLTLLARYLRGRKYRRV